jgi:hypothetical protein
MNRMRVDLLPVTRNLARHAPQNVRSQVRSLLAPRQNDKAGVVGDQMDITPARPRVPAKETVAAAQMSRGARPGQDTRSPAAGFDQIGRGF